MLTDLDHPLAPTGGGGGSGSAGFTYADGLPNQPIQVSVTSIFFELTGPWQTTLDLPATATAAATAAAPSSRSSAVCLTHDSWKKALANKQISLPDGLTGKLAISFMKEGDYNYQVMATTLDGSDRQDIGYGDWPGLSPDGSTLVDTGQTGLVMVDLATNQTTPIAGTTISDRGVIWSPDGKQIAFTRGPASGLIGAPGPYSIWIAGADGSNLRQVTPGSDANHAMAWMPAGDRILYTVEKADGAFVRTIDVQTGEVVSLFETQLPLLHDRPLAGRKTGRLRRNAAGRPVRPLYCRPGRLQPPPAGRPQPGSRHGPPLEPGRPLVSGRRLGPGCKARPCPSSP